MTEVCESTELAVRLALSLSKGRSPERVKRYTQRFLPADVWSTVLKGKNSTMTPGIAPVLLHHFARKERFHLVALVNASAAAGKPENHSHD